MCRESETLKSKLYLLSIERVKVNERDAIDQHSSVLLLLIGEKGAEVVEALLEALKDKDDSVNDSVHKSLCKIATGSSVNPVLTTFCEYYSTKKISANHKACILRAVEQMCMQQGEHLTQEVVQNVTSLIVNEMISSNEYLPETQMPSSGILVAIGNHWCDQVIGPLSNILTPGVAPHYIVLHTLGTLAATNINGTIPFLKDILAKMLPTMGMLKIDALKQAFSYALGNFSTALNDYFGNSQNVNANLKKSDFSTEISIAFDVLHIHWLHSSEPKVVENVLEAIGPMFSLMQISKIKELVPQLVPIICNIYKRSTIDAFYVTQSVTLILVECVKQEVTMSPTIIHMINQTMFQLILTFPDYDHPQKIKNHFELLRCFDVLATNFSEQIIEYLFLQIKNSNDDDKMRSTIILTHLITSSEMSVKVLVGRFNATLKTMVISEQSCKMKRILLKAIVALAYRQYLNESEDSGLIEFIINQCGTEITQANKSEITFLIDDCENSLYLLSSTVPNMKNILWPILMKSLLVHNNNETQSIITKCLSQLSKVEGDSTDKAENVASLPSNESIYVRCMSLLIDVTDEKMICNVIQFLINYCSSINKDLKASWEIDLQKLSTFLVSKNFNTDTWESMILDLFRSSIYLVNDNKWIEAVSHKILEQIPRNEKYIKRKGVLYKFLSVLLCHTSDVQTVNHRLDTLFNALHNSSLEESKEIARALGIASIKHGLVVLERLDGFTKELESRKSNRFLNFNFIKNSKQETDLMNLKMSITLCYGEISKEALDEQILKRLIGSETDGNGAALRWNISQLKSNQVNLKIHSLNTIQLLGNAVVSVSNPNIVINDRWNLINLALDRMFENSSKEVVNIELYAPVIKTITSLTKMSTTCPPEERNLILRTLCTKVYNSLVLLTLKVDSVEEESAKYIHAKFLNDSLIALNSLIKQFMIQSVCPSTLDDFLSILEEWMDNNYEEIRTSAMRSIQVALVCFIQNVKLTYENPSKFNQAGFIVGKMVPRCADRSNTVRYIAVDCIKILIQIIDLYEGRSVESNSETFQNLAAIQMQIGTNEMEKFLSIITDLAEIISNKIPHQQTLHLIDSLLSGLYGDYLPGASCNAVLNVLIKNKGQDIYQNVNNVMDYILSCLMEVQGNIKVELLKVLLTFANYHTQAIVTYLLLQPLPFDKAVNECWEALASDENIVKIITEILYHTLKTESLFEEALKYENRKVVSVQSLAAISALCKMVKKSEMNKICLEKFHEIFSMLYVVFVCFIGSDPPAHSALTGAKSEKYGFVPNHQATKLSPAKIALETLEQFLMNANCGKAAEACRFYDNMESGDYLGSFTTMVSNLVEAFCKNYDQFIIQIVSSLNGFSRSSLIPQRIAVMAFFTQLIRHRCLDNSVLTETVITTLNVGWKDTALEVRAISLSGLSNIRYLKPEHCEHYLLPVINVLFNALDDYQGSTQKTNIPLVALKGLNGLFSLKILRERPLSELPPILQRIKSFFNTENPALRELSVLLFGELVSLKTSEEYSQHVFSVFPCFVYHLADEDVHVSKACKQTLKKICPLMNAEKTNNMIQTHLLDSARLHLSDFTMDLMKKCSTELPEYVPQFIEGTISYLNSPWDSIRANATLAIGILFLNFNSSEDKYDEIKRHLMVRLLQLLKDSNIRVRSAAAISLSSLYQTPPA